MPTSLQSQNEPTPSSSTQPIPVFILETKRGICLDCVCLLWDKRCGDASVGADQAL